MKPCAQNAIDPALQLMIDNPWANAAWTSDEPLSVHMRSNRAMPRDSAGDLAEMTSSRSRRTAWPVLCKVAGVAGLFAVLTLAACGSPPPQAQKKPPPPSVVVQAARMKDITQERSFTGRIEAVDKVQLRARVQGFLKARDFNEGSEVKKGQLLFEIEPASFEIAVAQADANLSSAEAALTLAQQTYDRTRQLVSTNTQSQSQLDSAQAALMQAKATVEARQADLRAARLNLSYTRIVAPMDGRVGRATYSIGNLVGPTSDPLVTLVAQDPVYVTFPVPQEVLLQVARSGISADSVLVKIKLADGSTYDHEGKVRFADVQAIASTDSVIVRATMPNPERLLVDQEIVSVSVIRKKAQPRLVISQSALLLDQQGPYVLAVGADNKVAIKRITTGTQRGPLIVVTSGLEAGEKVIVSGHQKVRPGMVVATEMEPDAPAPATE